MTPQPWDWTNARERVAGFEPAQVHALDEALTELRAFLRLAGINQPDQEHAEAMWIGARLAIGNLMPLLLHAAGADLAAHAHIQGHVDVTEEVCCAARNLWPAPARPDNEREP